MTEQNALPKNDNRDGIEKRARATFPRLSLRRTLELPKALYETGEGEQVRRLTVFNKIGKSPDSGPSRTLITTATTGYGLISGGQSTDFFSLTRRGLIIVGAVPESDPFEAALDALFDNDIFSSFITRFHTKSLNEEVAVDYLKTTHRLIEADAKAAFSVFKENILDYGLTQDISGKKVVISKEMALENRLSTPPARARNVSSPNDTRSREGKDNEAESEQTNPKHTPKANIVNRTNPQFHFNIQIHLPENAPSDVYDAIFKSIATHLLNKDEEQ